ncbi:MAG: NAD-dependent epimerase/dehydratase family protein [Saprospiraceae bacterium]
MTTIDRSKPVLVTGATGYVAGWLVKKLLEEGLTVHAAVRDPKNEIKVAHLSALANQTPGKIKFFKSDLLDEGSYAEAMADCELVFHTASPFTTEVADPQKELIDPAVNGTKNVLEQANQTASVKRIVLTSSCAAIYTDAIDTENAPGGQLTEKIWNTTASLDYQPYSYSKTLAEKAAWELAAAQDRWDLVVVNPCLVMGPPLAPESTTSESFNLLKQMGDGTMKAGAPDLGIGLVDVRDLAVAHFRAGFTSEAEGRHIICGHNSSFLELGQVLHQEYGNTYPLPKTKIPKWLLLIVGPFVNKAFSRKFIRNNVNHTWKADNSKSKNALGMSYRPLKETMVDSFQVLVDYKMI